jgi:hypothetical protein
LDFSTFKFQMIHDKADSIPHNLKGQWNPMVAADVPPLTPFPGEERAFLVPDTNPPPSMFSPSLHLDFMTFGFQMIHDKADSIPSNLKGYSSKPLLQ